MTDHLDNQWTVAAVIPAYNNGPYLQRTIESVLGQSRPADEIIIVDDGSVDNTADVARQFGDKVTYIYQVNAGASAARNKGIETARSTWIAFLDGDDEWRPDYLKAQMDLLKRNPQLSWSVANFTHCHCKEKRTHPQLDPEKAATLMGGRDYCEDYFDACIQKTSGWTGTTIVHRDALYKAGLFTVGQPMANDVDMWWRIAYQYPQVGYNCKPLAIYHQHIPGSITKKFKDPLILSDLLAKHLKIAKQYNRQDAFTRNMVYFLKYWIHKYFFDERIYKIRPMIKRFKKQLPSGYYRILYLLTICPWLTQKLQPLLSKLNKVFRLPI